MDKFLFDYIDKKNINNNKVNNIEINKDKDKNKEENKNITNNITNKEEISLSNSNKNKSKKIYEKDKNEKIKDYIIKKLRKENDHLKKLLIVYKLNKNKIGKSTEKIYKFTDSCLDNKMSTLSANKTNTNNNYSSNLNPYNDFSINSYSNNISKSKNSYINNNILENYIDRAPLIQKNNKSKNKNGEGYSVLLTDGNIGRSIKKSKGTRSNPKKNKTIITEIKLKKTNIKIKKINKIKINSLYYKKLKLI